ncbi:MAG: hypothetical protein COA96_06830 [SAR86 cluster bacterium]|uniref:HTH tetR-type domain-containing protein n=1 Tax=SAR86 cluster bacterium TaxID=2030880 RepID=A0A2A5B2N8_9GAMM|nr:MAG: hypothetical protein COA96_06830 [SAR86 cluster bacterium]
MFNEQQKTGSSYHHGNVKEALVDAGIKFVESNRIDLISLRRLSKEVGVTPSAVYNHFADKDSLMLAIKLRLYDFFSQFFEKRFSVSENPEQSLLEMCIAYYEFSREFPSQFRFLFDTTLPMEWSTPAMVEISGRGIVRTRKLVFDIYQKYQIPCSEEDVVNATLLVWSQLHGIITLKNSGLIAAAVAFQNWPAKCALEEDQQVQNLIENHVQTMVNGIINSQRSEGHH